MGTEKLEIFSQLDNETETTRDHTDCQRGLSQTDKQYRDVWKEKQITNG